MAVRISGPQFYAWDDDGNPLAGGKLYAYESGSSSTLKDTFTGEDGATANANPVILNAAGYASVYLDGSYNLVLLDANDAEVWSKDPVSSGLSQEWANCSAAAYASTTSFTVSGNKTDIFTTGRGVRLYDGATYVYAFVASSSYANPVTTVVIQSTVVVVGLTQVCASVVSTRSSVDRGVEFDSVADMLTSNLSAGVIATTKSYYAFSGSVGAIGGAEYQIVTPAEYTAITSIGVADGYTDHVLANGNVAMLNRDNVSLLQSGADSSGVSNSTNSIQGYNAAVSESVFLASTYPLPPNYDYTINWNGASPVASLSSNDRLSKTKIETIANPVYSIEGVSVTLDHLHVTGDGVNIPSQVAYLQDGSVSPLIFGCFFDSCGYQVIQASEAATYGPRIIGNISIDSPNDFVLQNNDFQDGITHSWLVIGNYCDQTNSGVAFGATESRGIGFTSCYGGIAIGNSMVGTKGDSATHLENIQETAFIGNYYRDNYVDILFSGLGDRFLTRLYASFGSIAITDVVTDSVSGATGTVLFWYSDGEIAQLINVVGIFGEGNAFTTSGGASGTVGYVNPVQMHSNHIGNIYHKTTNDTVLSFDSAGAGYTLRNFMIGNSWNNQGGVTGKTAMSFPGRVDMSTIMGSFTGWENACDGGGGVANDNEFAFNKYWGNQLNVNGRNIVRDCQWFKEKFYDGEFYVSDLRSSKIEGCLFEAGVIDISSTTFDNTWKDNFVGSGVTLTSLSPADFNVWESRVYKKNGQIHEFNFETTIALGAPAKELIATLVPLGGNTTAVLTWEITSRSGGAGKQYCEVFRAFIDWSSSSVPAIAYDAANFSSGTKSTGITLDITGNNVEINADYVDTGLASLMTGSLKTKVSGITVNPVNFLDII